MKKGISLLTSALLALSAMPLAVSAETQYDLNGDGLLNGCDVQFVFETYMESSLEGYGSELLTDEIRAQIASECDFNGDNKIDMADVGLLLQKIKNDNRIGDVNCDGMLEARDASDVLRYYALTSIHTTVPSEYRGLEFGVLALGDYHANGIIDARDACAILTEYARSSVE